MPANKILIKSVETHDNLTKISGDFILESKKAFSRYEYYIDDENNLHLKIYGVLASPICRYSAFKIKINSRINEVIEES